jgi:hypothetical protein
MSIITADIKLTSFNCPHCKVLAQQFWWSVRAEELHKDRTPSLVTGENLLDTFENFRVKVDDEGKRKNFFDWLTIASTGEVTLADRTDAPYSRSVTNLNMSKCFACNRISVWIYNALVHPITHSAPPANVDMPGDAQRDYFEAAQIATQSPRGAAALLRLAIQRLMPHLGQKGKDLNDDIAALVTKGLDVRIQRSLDIVRVIGNHAVHPGQIDLNDSPETVDVLFQMVNVIVETMISQPKQIEAAYRRLPESARKAIETRDKPKA